MPHTFDKVPLKQVEATVILGAPVSLDIDRLHAIHQALRGSFPDTALSMNAAEIGQPFAQMTMGAQPAMRLFNVENGTDLLVYPNAVQTRWKETAPERPYVRYDALREYVRAALEALGGVPEVVRLGYRTLAPLEGNPWEWINEDWIAPVVAGDILTHEIVCGYRLTSGVDYRLSVQLIPEGMFITSDGGLTRPGTSALEMLDLVHDETLNEFVKAVSATYRTKWGYRE